LCENRRSKALNPDEKQLAQGSFIHIKERVLNNMVEKKFEIPGASGKPITMTFAEPEGGGKAIVILCHGFMSSKGSQTNRDLTKRLLPKQIATCRFDFFGHGEDGHPFQELTLSACLEQLEAVLAWAQKTPGMKIGLLGSSFGGLVALHAASRHPELSALALKCPVSDYPPIWRDRLGAPGMAHWQQSGSLSFMSPEGRARLDYRFFEDLLSYKTYSEAEKITTPTHIIHGEADDDVPFSQSVRLHEILRSDKELLAIEGADHSFSKQKDFDRMLDSLTEWFVQTMSLASP